MPVFLLVGAAFLGSGMLMVSNTKHKKMSIQESARAVPPETQSVGCFVGQDIKRTTREVRQAVNLSELIQKPSESDQDDESSEDELISAGAPATLLRRGASGLATDVATAAWMFEEHPSPPPGSQVMAILPASAASHLFIIVQSDADWMYVFEKWKDGVSVSRFRDAESAKTYRAGFVGHYRKRKKVVQLTSVNIKKKSNTPSTKQPIRISDLLLWSSNHSEFRQFTDNCHTYAVNLAAHLGMEPPKAAWEHLLYDAY